MAPIDIELSAILELLRKKAGLKNLDNMQRVLNASSATLQQSGYDGWDGGQYYYSLTLDIPIELLVELENEIVYLESEILQEAKSLRRGEPNEHFREVIIRSSTETGVSGIPLTSVSENDTQQIWLPNHFRLFISHTSPNKAYAHELKESLKPYGISSFVAHDDIQPTAEWQLKIEAALESMDAMAALLTNDFCTSKWCDQETGIAMGLKKLIVTIRYGANPHGFLEKYQGLNAAGTTTLASEVAKNVFNILRLHECTKFKMYPILIEHFINSSSYAEARERISLLEDLPVLSREQQMSLQQALAENDQIQHAYGVPEKLGSLINRHNQSLISNGNG